MLRQTDKKQQKTLEGEMGTKLCAQIKNIQQYSTIFCGKKAETQTLGGVGAKLCAAKMLRL